MFGVGTRQNSAWDCSIGSFPCLGLFGVFGNLVFGFSFCLVGASLVLLMFLGGWYVCCLS